MPERFRQFPLPLKFDASARFETFYPAGNEQPLAAITALLGQAAWLYLHGPSSSGVSHLLQAACNAAEARSLRSIYLDLAEMPGASAAAQALVVPEFFDGLEQYELLALDNVDSLGNAPQWQEALFYLLVKLQASPGARVLFGAHGPPAALTGYLPDLRSRLGNATAYALCAVDDEARAAIIALHARQLGCELADDVARFVVQRYSRELPALLDAVHKLERQALSQSRKLTVPFVKEVLDL